MNAQSYSRKRDKRVKWNVEDEKLTWQSNWEYFLFSNDRRRISFTNIEDVFTWLASVFQGVVLTV